MKVSLIATVLNEENSIGVFLDSILKQSKLPDEVVIADGGSSDLTVANIKSKILDIKYKPRFKIIIKKGNRSIGRNTAIKNSSGDIVAVSDAGCILDKNWLENIVKPFKENSIDVVAGYYKGKASSIFEKCLIPYVLVMPDRVDPNNFMPASRSMAFRKSIWKKAGGFHENLYHNEDYAFAKKLKGINARVVFKKDAIAYWIPRENIKEASIMFFRFALGDAESGIIRPKVILLFARYLTGLGLVISFLVLRSYFILYTLYFILAAYAVWAIVKNYRYVRNPLAFFILPILQITADIAVILGTIWGIQNKL